MHILMPLHGALKNDISYERAYIYLYSNNDKVLSIETASR